LWLKPAWSWRRPVSRSFSLRISSTWAFSVVRRSFWSRSWALSVRSRSISVIAVATEAIPPATLSSAPWIGRKA
jgi:hypothetical protein